MAVLEGPGNPDVKLRTGSIGLWDVVFQSITVYGARHRSRVLDRHRHRVPGTTLPLAVIIALVGCGFTAIAIGQTAKHIPSAGGIYTTPQGPQSGLGLLRRLALSRLRRLPARLRRHSERVSDRHTLVTQGWSGPARLAGVLDGVHHRRRVLPDVLRRPPVRQGRHHPRGIEIIVFVALSLTIIGSDRRTTASRRSTRRTRCRTTRACSSAPSSASSPSSDSRPPRRSAKRREIQAAPCRAACCTRASASACYYVFCCYAWSGRNARHRAAPHRHGGNDWIQFAHEPLGAAWWIVFFALVNSNLACAAAAVNNAARVLFAMGRAGVLPSFSAACIRPTGRRTGRRHGAGAVEHLDYLAGEKFPVLGFSIVGGTFTILAIVIYMLACAACIGYFTGRRRASRTRMCCCTSCARSLGIIVFLSPCTRSTSASTRRSSPPSPSPAELERLGRADWLVLGIVVTLYMRSQKPEALDRATHAFGGEADELPGDGQPESMALGR